MFLSYFNILLLFLDYLPEVDSRDYLGSLSTAFYVLPCQRWDSQTPNRHAMTIDEQFPDRTVSDAENFCRDPVGDGYLWCYIDSPDIRWEQCSKSGLFAARVCFFILCSCCQRTVFVHIGTKLYG